MRFRKILGLVFPLQMQHVTRFLHLLLKVPPVLHAFCVFSLSLFVAGIFCFSTCVSLTFSCLLISYLPFSYPVPVALFFPLCFLHFFLLHMHIRSSFFLLLVIPRFVSLLLRVLFLKDLPGSGSSCFFLL